MITLQLAPRLGIGPIRLGIERQSVRRALADSGIQLHAEHGSSDYFYEASIQVEYHEDGTAWFVGVSSHPRIALIFEAQDVFDLEAPTVFDLFAAHDQSGAHDFTRFEYTFPNQILTLYDADPQYDRRRAEQRMVWGQIGTGDCRYLEAILKIRKGVLNRKKGKKEA